MAQRETMPDQGHQNPHPNPCIFEIRCLGAKVWTDIHSPYALWDWIPWESIWRGVWPFVCKPEQLLAGCTAQVGRPRICKDGL